MSCLEEFASSDVHCVPASYLGSERHTCTLLFSPSRKICGDKKIKTALSRRLTKLLRHEAVHCGLSVGSDGYVSISSILDLPEYHQYTVFDVLYVVKSDAKRRYSVRLDKAVDLHTQRGRCTSHEDYTSSSLYTSNPLLAEELIAVAQDKLYAAVPVTADSSCKDRFSKVNRDTSLPVGPRPVAFVVVSMTGKHNAKLKANTTHAEEIASVGCWRGECACPLERRIAFPPRTVGTAAASVSFKLATLKTNSDTCYAACSTVERDGNHTTTGTALREKSCIAEKRAHFWVGSEGSLIGGFVDASVISVRAVQGHSMSVVDSNQLLRRVLACADLPGKILPSVQQNDGAAGSQSEGGKSSRNAIPRSPSTSASADCAGICVVHGTYWRCWQRIRKTGLSRMFRNHIHFAIGLPDDAEIISGMRFNSEILIFLDVERALAAGLPLYVSGNGVVLSPGNEQGIIECRFFKKAIDRRTGKCLLIDGEEEHCAENTALQK